MKQKNLNENAPVNPCNDLPSVMEEILQAMPEFRQKKDRKFNQAAHWIQQASNLERAHDQWTIEANRLLHEGKALLNPSEPQQQDHARAANLIGGYLAMNKDKKYGGKRRAKTCRSAFLRREGTRGNPLTPDPLRGPYYRNGRGLLVGLTFSSDLGNRWWVNFKKECDEVVVLCDGNTGAVRVVHLAQSFFDEYRQHFHPSDDGLIQITLRVRDERIYAQVPDRGQIDVTKYADPEPLVC